MLLFFLKLSLTENQAVHTFGFLAYILHSKLVVKIVGFGAIFYIQHFNIGRQIQGYMKLLRSKPFIRSATLCVDSEKLRLILFPSIFKKTSCLDSISSTSGLSFSKAMPISLCKFLP